MLKKNGAATVENDLAAPQNVKELPHDLAIPILGVHSREMETDDHTKTWTGMFIAALFIIAPKWKQPKCLPTDEWKYMVYPSHGILLFHKKEWNTDMCYNLNEPWEY